MHHKVTLLELFGQNYNIRQQSNNLFIFTQHNTQ